MPHDLKNRVIVITGASSGIGEATAIASAKAGMHIVLAARRREKLEAVADRIRKLRRDAVVVECDVTKPTDVARLVSRTMDEFGKIDAFFANAGFGIMASVEAISDEQMHSQYETNFLGTMHCIRAVMPIFRKQGNGHLLISRSLVSELPIPTYRPYAATKAAQDSIAASLRAEVASLGIHVTSVHPTGTDTEFGHVVRKESAHATIKANTPRFLKQPASHVAYCIVKALRRPRAEVWPSPVTRMFAALTTLLPSLGAWFGRRFMMRRMRESLDAEKEQRDGNA